MSNFFARAARSWRLIKASTAVLNADGELLVLPLLSGAIALVLGGGMVAQAMSDGTFAALKAGEAGAIPDGFYLWLFAFYLVQYAVVTFFNTALVGAAIQRLDGEDPSVMSALGIAVRRLPQIIGYAIVSATVGVLLRMIAERLGFIGRLIAGGLNLAWVVTTFLVVPVIAVEGRDPISAIERSVELLGKSWGENVIGNVGISFLLGIASTAILLVGMGGYFLIQNGDDIAGIPIVAASFMAFVALLAFGAALQAVYAAAVYYYAVMGEPPEGFDRELIRGAFTAKPEAA